MERIGRTAVAVLASATISGALLVGSPLVVSAAHRVDVDSFLTGLACVESGGRYQALNQGSGAFGKYQIMPRIWPAWAARYLNNKWARPSPRNQEFIARQRITDLYQLHGRWRLVAHWWKTGNATADETNWSLGAMHYVDAVMSTAHIAAAASAQRQLPAACFPGDFGTPMVRTSAWPRVTVTGGLIYVRSGPGAENDAVGTVKRGETMAVLGSAHDARGKRWLRVGLHDGSTGWVAAWFTQPMGRG